MGEERGLAGGGPVVGVDCDFEVLAAESGGCVTVEARAGGEEVGVRGVEGRGVVVGQGVVVVGDGPDWRGGRGVRGAQGADVDGEGEGV